MSFDVTTLALAKSYTDQHGGGGGSVGDITAEDVIYHDSFELGLENVGQALDALVTGVDATRKDVLRLNKSEHTHDNKTILDKFGETDGNPTYNGEPIGGENTIYIPATINTSSDPPTIETSATFEQIEAAYNLGREQILKLVAEGSVDFIYMLPLVFAGQGEAFYFETIIRNQGVFASVTPTNEWELEFYDITPTPKEEIVNDVLAALPTWTGGSY